MDKGQLKDFFEFLNRLKKFFNDRKFVEVMTPPMVKNPGIEPHIHPFQVHSKIRNENTEFYLNTSPEFWMKKILSENADLSEIYTLCYSFRDEPISNNHRTQFLMLEWYRSNSTYEIIMKDCIELIDHLSFEQSLNVPVIITVNELFKKYVDIQILDFLEVDDLKNLIIDKFKDIHVPDKKLNWDDYFFLIFLNKIEPNLREIPFLILTEYPYHLSALSKINTNDPRVCERFEVYINGIEIANCFHELCDLSIQKERFEINNSIKLNNYNYQLPKPKMLYESLKNGLPSPSGIALGVERLYTALSGHSFFLSNH